MPHFADPQSLKAIIAKAPQPDTDAMALARARQAVLTKPPGALGRLEDIAIWLAGWQGCERPTVERTQVIVFAGNHGIAARGVSPFPAAVTAQMVANFDAGGAAINAISRSLGHDMTVRSLQLDQPTADFTTAPAMTAAECLEAMNEGAAAVDPAADLAVFGEMGIANTTAAAALCAAVFGGNGADWVGPGTGHGPEGIALKARVVDDGLAVHRAASSDALETLRRLGGRELAAIAGAILAARTQRIPVILDGFIACAAAATLTRENPDALSHCLAGHRSAEPGHDRLLASLGLSPILDLGMRLGEGTGAALAAAVVKCAAATHSQMATFAEAGVSGASD